MNIFDLLTKEQKKNCQIFHLNKGNILFHEDDECEEVGIVLKGDISIVSYSLNGTEIIYNNLKEGQMFGNNLLFSSYPFYKGNVIAKEKSEVVIIRKRILLSFFAENEDFLISYLKYSSDFSKTLNNQIKLLSFDSAEERLLFLLKSNKTMKIKSVTSLAKTLFLTREATSRLLTKMEREGKIKRSGNIVELLK